MKYKKIGAFIVTMLIATSVVGCGTAFQYKNGTGVENGSAYARLDIYKVNQDKEGNKLNIIVTNPLNSKVQLTFGSTQEYDFVLYSKEGKQAYKWSDDKAFGTMIVNKEIAAKESLEYSIDLSSLELKAGEYKYEFYLVAKELSNTSPLKGKITIK